MQILIFNKNTKTNNSETTAPAGKATLLPQQGAAQGGLRRAASLGALQSQGEGSQVSFLSTLELQGHHYVLISFLKKATTKLTNAQDLFCDRTGQKAARPSQAWPSSPPPPGPWCRTACSRWGERIHSLGL